MHVSHILTYNRKIPRIIAELHVSGFVVTQLVSDAAGENRAAMNQLLTIPASDFLDSDFMAAYPGTWSQSCAV